jgi:large repetitive protein
MTRTAGYAGKIAPGLTVPLLALAAIAGPAVSPAAASTGAAATAASLDTPPLAPNAMFAGTASEPLSGVLPGSSAAIPEVFTVLNSGTLPPGVIVTTTGAVTGIPTADGIYTATVTACDSDGCTHGLVTFNIAPNLAPCDHLPTTAFPPAPVGTAEVTS